MSSTVLSLQHSNLSSSAGWSSGAAFDRFIRWLGPDEELAAQKYKSIRSRLIMMFKARRCVFAEDLADATIERVTRKLSDLNFRFSGDPALFCYGVAKKIYLENQRQIMIDHRISTSSPAVDPANPEWENMLKQLDEALSTISQSDRELILSYYSGDSEKTIINHRRALAEKLGIGLNTLRLRVFRIRKEIKSYMLQSSAHTHHASRLSA